MMSKYLAILKVGSRVLEAQGMLVEVVEKGGFNTGRKGRVLLVFKSRKELLAGLVLDRRKGTILLRGQGLCLWLKPGQA